MEIIFMGTGTSQGVPMIAVSDDPPCPLDLHNPMNWRTRTSIHVHVGDVHIQVDAAQEFRLQCIRNRISQIDYFILTHGHADHILGMDDLRRFCDARGGEPLPVYSTQAGLSRVSEIFPYAIRNRPEFPGYPAFDLRVIPDPLEVPGATIHHVLLPHGRTTVLGLIFHEHATGRKVAYFPDCARVTPEHRSLARGVDVLIIDALRPNPHPTHLSIGEAIEVARDIQARQTWFVHMTALVDVDAERKHLDASMDFAWDGLRLQI